MSGLKFLISRPSQLKLIAVLGVSLLLLGSGFVEAGHDCTRPEHNSKCAICWISFSTSDLSTSQTTVLILPAQPADLLPFEKPVFSLLSLSSDSRAPPAA